MKKVLLLLFAGAVAAACTPDAPPPLPHAVTTVQPPLTPAEVRAYASGRAREIELTTAALQMLSCTGNAEHRTVLSAGAAADHVEAEGAVTAGMRVGEYRQLVARVDALLRPAPRLDTTAIHITNSAMRRLDSLRVELMVLRARVNAEQSDTHPVRRKPCVAPW